MIASEGILGRDRELEVVADLVASATAGGGALLIHGNTGIGKSALLERAVGLAQDAGMRVLTTTGVRTETNLPFAGLHQLLRPILAGSRRCRSRSPRRLASRSASSRGRPRTRSSSASRPSRCLPTRPPAPRFWWSPTTSSGLIVHPPMRSPLSPAASAPIRL